MPDEVLAIATRCGMHLYEAECWLCYTGLSLATNAKEQAQRSLTKAQTMIKQMGYHRRDVEVNKLVPLVS